MALHNNLETVAKFSRIALELLSIKAQIIAAQSQKHAHG